LDGSEAGCSQFGQRGPSIPGVKGETMGTRHPLILGGLGLGHPPGMCAGMSGGYVLPT